MLRNANVQLTFIQVQLIVNETYNLYFAFLYFISTSK